MTRNRKTTPRPRGTIKAPPLSATAPNEAATDVERTARNTRTRLATGSVAEESSLASSLRIDLSGSLDVGERASLRRRSNREVRKATAFIDATGIATLIEDRRNASKIQPGRPADIPVRAVLVALYLAVNDSRPNLTLAYLRDILCFGIWGIMRHELGIKTSPRPTHERAAMVLWDDSMARSVSRAFARLLHTVDPSVLPKGRKRSWAELDALKKDLSLDQQVERRKVLDDICNALIETTIAYLPEPNRALLKRTPLSACIDASPLKLWATGRGIDSPSASADPDGGYYVRGDHKHDDPFTTANVKVVKDKVFWARDLHYVVSAANEFAPNLFVAMTTDTPSVDPAGNARRLLASMNDRGYAPGTLAGDILYTNQKPENFQNPARDTGWDLVLGYGVNQLGVQGAHPTGVLLIEGEFYAPCIKGRRDLINATTDYNAGTITAEQYADRLEQRNIYRMRTKQKADPEKGRRERVTCPAGGNNPTAICALKPKSEAPRPTKQADGHVVDARPHIRHLPVITKGTCPTVCSNEAVNIDLDPLPADAPARDVGAHASWDYATSKFKQPIQYGTVEHSLIYKRARQTQEGLHGTAKGATAADLSTPGIRRVHGWAAQQLFAAFLTVRANMDRIRRWAYRAIEGPDGVRRVPLPEIPLDAHTPLAPPGHAPPPGAPTREEAA